MMQRPRRASLHDAPTGLRPHHQEDFRAPRKHPNSRVFTCRAPGAAQDRQAPRGPPRGTRGTFHRKKKKHTARAGAPVRGAGPGAQDPVPAARVSRPPRAPRAQPPWPARAGRPGRPRRRRRGGAAAEAAAATTRRRGRKGKKGELKYYLAAGGCVTVLVLAVYLALAGEGAGGPRASASRGSAKVNDAYFVERVSSDAAANFTAKASPFFDRWSYADLSYGMDGVDVVGAAMIGMAGALQTCADKSDTEGGAIPASYDFRQAQPSCAHDSVYDQGNCSSSYAIAAATSLSYRFCASDPVQYKALRLSPQQVVSCDKKSRGCQGGGADRVWAYIARRGLYPESCVPFAGAKEAACKSDCKEDQKLKSLGHCAMGGEKNIRREVFNWGPVVALVYVKDDFLVYSSGVYSPTDASIQQYGADGQPLQQAVTVIGWGKSEGKKYWLVANSWGKGWGEDGYARIAVDTVLREGLTLVGTPATADAIEAQARQKEEQARKAEEAKKERAAREERIKEQRAKREAERRSMQRQIEHMERRLQEQIHAPAVGRERWADLQGSMGGLLEEMSALARRVEGLDEKVRLRSGACEELVRQKTRDLEQLLHAQQQKLAMSAATSEEMSKRLTANVRKLASAVDAQGRRLGSVEERASAAPTAARCRTPTTATPARLSRMESLQANLEDPTSCRLSQSLPRRMVGLVARAHPPPRMMQAARSESWGRVAVVFVQSQVFAALCMGWLQNPMSGGEE
ncbi:unnamed protein product [Prorocentrum cordatum]|uniref:Peptidase C1A papain C-terminal domain-containing protein n=1 Tax=Prorocentrum cordatum TaxID=2364126 RepID=A0ABN9YK43_9DINO|nr:unnamed protein product [Polarella glacialis]